MSRSALAVVSIALLGACSSGHKDLTAVDAPVVDGDADTDTDSDTDSDADADTDTDTDTDTAPTGSTGLVDTCGDAVVDDGEQCDFGSMNAEDGNCLLDCTLSAHQEWTVSLGLLPVALVDAEGVADKTAPLGTGAWKPADSDLNLDGLAKLELNLPLFDPRTDPGFLLLQIADFPIDQISDADPIGTVPLGDVAQITFDAKFPAGQSPQFYLYLYTQPDGVDDGASWYGRRLIARTHSITTPAPVADTWIRYSVTGPDSQFLFEDSQATGGLPAPDQPLHTLTAGAFDWSTVDPSLPVSAIDYAAEAMRYVSIQTSSGSGTTDFDGTIDRLTIELVDGRTFQVDLEP